MPATMVVHCPNCKNQLKGPPEIQGKKVRCKKCGNKFRIPAAGEKGQPGESAPARKAGPGDSDHGAGQNPYAFVDADKPAVKETPKTEPTGRSFAKATPYDITELNLDPRCPHCAKEMESREAIICLNCGYNLQTRTFAKTKVVYEITAKDRTNWLMPGFLCIVGILLIGGFDAWFCLGLDKFWAAWEDPAGANLPASFSRGLRAWVVFVTLFGVWFMGKFAYRRLILNPRPPEQEKKK